MIDINLGAIRQDIDYNPETGEFRWKRSNSNCVKVGDVIGSVNSHGYLRIGWRGRRYQAHRIAFLLTYGRWPNGEIDHQDGDRQNNRISNRREATGLQNSANRRLRSDNQCRLKGVWLHKATGKYQTAITVGGNKVHLGLFEAAEEAHAAYIAAAKLYFGDFARAG